MNDKKLKIRIGAISSANSSVGLETFINILGENIEFQKLDFEQCKSDSAADEFDLFFLHNTVNVHDQILQKSILYCLHTVTKQILENDSVQQRIKNYSPLQIWCNTNSAVIDLKKVGIDAITTYRPFTDYNTPKHYSPLPKKKSILWYFKPDHPPMTALVPEIITILNRIDETEVLIFPADKISINKPNIKAIGRIDLNEWLPKVHGMVRVSDRLDFGRSTFDVLGYGRWCIYYNMDEEDVFSTDKISELPAIISHLLDTENDAAGLGRFTRAKRFDRENLYREWLNRITALLDIRTKATDLR